jgi:plasmid stability protein
MKNITVSLDDETYRLVRIRAAKSKTSVSALVRRFLTDLVAGERRFDELKRQEHEIRAQIIDFCGGDRLSRDDVHERDA